MAEKGWQAVKQNNQPTIKVIVDLGIMVVKLWLYAC